MPGVVDAGVILIVGAGVVDAGVILIVGVKDTNEQLIAGVNNT
jgi:hypothetical protein